MRRECSRRRPPSGKLLPQSRPDFSYDGHDTAFVCVYLCHMTTLDTYVQDLPQPDQGWTAKAGLGIAATGLLLILALAFMAGGATDQAADAAPAMVSETEQMLAAMRMD